MSNELRVRQLSDRIRTLTAELVERRLKDPRLGFVTITDARLTGDLSQASVFYTVFGDDEARASTQAALESASGMLRGEINKRLGLRQAPSLTFILDAVPENAALVDDLLAKARESDQAIARASVGASYAGEPDPYGPRPTEDELAAEDEDDTELDGADGAESRER